MKPEKQNRKATRENDDHNKEIKLQNQALLKISEAMKKKEELKNEGNPLRQKTEK